MQTLVQYLGGITITLILLEALLSGWHQMHENKRKDMLGSVSIALFCMATNLLCKGFILAALIRFQGYAIFHLANHWLTWIFLFLFSDLAHYGFHYLEHKCRFLWAGHVIHHSSAYYNLSVGIRSPLSSNMYRLLIQVPLCLVGFEPAMIIIMETLILTYAFLLHTEHITKMGWLETIFNTPSHHRVHHGRNEKYLDKNFGAVLILWDKMFGTYHLEEEKPIYGITTGFNETNPVAIISHEWIAMAKDAAAAHTLTELLGYVVLKPGWEPHSDEIFLTQAPSCNFGELQPG